MASASAWLSPGMRAAWLAIVVFLIVGGWVLWRWLGLLCESSGSSGTETYCGGGGWEASGLAFAGLVASAIVIPTAAVVFRRRRLFLMALVAAVILATAQLRAFSDLRLQLRFVADQRTGTLAEGRRRATVATPVPTSLLSRSS
jgi:hypothetical protein